MLSNIKKRNEEGFTIIEVLIVLAIAGLILLIVFLAVPALQRNSRNTTIKNDASSFAAGFSEYASNNNGGQPASIAAGATAGSYVFGASGTAQATVKINGSDSVTLPVQTAVPGATKLAAGTIEWVKGIACDGTVSSRAISVWYAIETNGTTANQCVDS